MPRGFPLTDAQRQTVIRLTQAGVSAADCASKAGVNRFTVFRIRKAAGIESSYVQKPRRFRERVPKVIYDTLKFGDDDDILY